MILQRQRLQIHDQAAFSTRTGQMPTGAADALANRRGIVYNMGEYGGICEKTGVFGMKRICIGILAHVDAGKTTLCEAMLYRSGARRTLGRVDHGDAFLDTQALERERGITIFSKQAIVTLGETELVLLDTPGHVDFSSEMERTLQVLDYAVLLISGTDGVQGHTRTLWGLLRR